MKPLLASGPWLFQPCMDLPVDAGCGGSDHLLFQGDGLAPKVTYRGRAKAALGPPRPLERAEVEGKVPLRARGPEQQVSESLLFNS